MDCVYGDFSRVPPSWTLDTSESESGDISIMDIKDVTNNIRRVYDLR